MLDIKMIGSGDILQDYKNFFETLVIKYNIKNKEAFNKDLFEYMSKHVKPEYADPEEIGKLATQEQEKLEKMAEEFFEIVKKYSAGFDFYDGANKEIELLKKVREKQNGN